MKSDLSNLLARQARFEDLGSHFRRGGSSLDMADLWFAALLILIVAATGYIAQRISQERNKPGYRNPRALFRKLCKAHQLRYSQRRLLMRVARQQRLRQPCRLFVEPERLQENLLRDGLARQAESLRAIRHRLFGKQLSPEDPREGAA